MLVAGCVNEPPIMQETSRNLARNAVDEAAARHLPGIPVKPYSDCVINNATSAELIQLAKAGAAPDAGRIASDAWPVMHKITSRTETQSCLIEAISSDGSLRAIMNGAA